MFAADFHAASEHGAVLDYDASGVNISLHAARGAEHDAIAPSQIPFDISAHNHFARFDVRFHATVRSDCHMRVTEPD